VSVAGLDASERQQVVLALALMTLFRPGLLVYAREIATKVDDSGGTAFDAFRTILDAEAEWERVRRRPQAPMVDAWQPGARDPLGNPLTLSRTYDDCPYPCQMTLPHLHSRIVAPVRLALETAREALLSWNAMGVSDPAVIQELTDAYRFSPEIQMIDRALSHHLAARKVDER